MFDWLREWRVDRMTDRVARRPQRRRARAVYGASDAHSSAWESGGLLPRRVHDSSGGEGNARCAAVEADRPLPLEAGFAEARVARTGIGAQLLTTR